MTDALSLSSIEDYNDKINAAVAYVQIKMSMNNMNDSAWYTVFSYYGLYN